jgi:Ras GTPase-activating-like protein IQGAP2/3
MAPLNTFLTAVSSRVNDFFDELCRVQSLDERLSMDQFLTLAKKEKDVIHIQLNEMYSIHRLLLLHIDTVAPQQVRTETVGMLWLRVCFIG